MPRPGGDRRVVGQAVDSCGGGAPMRFEDQRIAERLRRLRRAQSGAVGRGDDAAAGVDLLDRVAERRAGRGGAVALGRRDGACDQRGGGKDARGVVDEDDLRRGVALRLEPGAHALLPAVAAERRRAEGGRGGGRKEGERSFVKRAVVGVDDDGRRAIARAPRRAPRARGRSAACRRRRGIASASPRRAARRARPPRR